MCNIYGTNLMDIVMWDQFNGYSYVGPPSAFINNIVTFMIY